MDPTTNINTNTLPVRIVDLLVGRRTPNTRRPSFTEANPDASHRNTPGPTPLRMRAGQPGTPLREQGPRGPGRHAAAWDRRADTRPTSRRGAPGTRIRGVRLQHPAGIDLSSPR